MLITRVCFQNYESLYSLKQILILFQEPHRQERIKIGEGSDVIISLYPSWAKSAEWSSSRHKRDTEATSSVNAC